MKSKKHLFFDLDDTLWDFAANSSLVLEKLFHEFELKKKLNTEYPVFLESYRKVNLQLWSLYYKKQIDKRYMRNFRFNEVFKQFDYDNYEDNILISEQYMLQAPHGRLLKQGCIDTLNYLKPNYHLHIITNGFTETQAIKIDGCGLRDFFTNIIISEEHNLVKPEEKIFRLAESLAGAHPAECVMIGDSMESDVEGAKNAGWEAIYYSESDAGKYKGWHVRNLGELQKIF
ncbi:MAG: YjjG family noncanonical pyrimidine nucleotidase [bacterium]|nr:YjjG family noncanonical pyrimidine nucleotidase [bacterium]